MTRDEVLRMLSIAQREARMLRHKYIRCEHLLLAVLKAGDEDTRALMARMGLTYDGLLAQISALKRPVCAADARFKLGAGTRRALQTARKQAGERPIASGDLIYGVVSRSPLVRRLLARLDVDTDALLTALYARA